MAIEISSNSYNHTSGLQIANLLVHVVSPRLPVKHHAHLLSHISKPLCGKKKLNTGLQYLPFDSIFSTQMCISGGDLEIALHFFS